MRPRTTFEGHTHDVCPNCGAELCAGRIFEDWAPRYADTTEEQLNYAEAYGWPEVKCGSQTIGIEDPKAYDGVSVWLYPCCGARYDRFTGNPLPTTRFC